MSSENIFILTNVFKMHGINTDKIIHVNFRLYSPINPNYKGAYFNINNPDFLLHAWQYIVEHLLRDILYPALEYM